MKRFMLWSAMTLGLAGTLAAANPDAAKWYVGGNQLYAQKQYDQAIKYYTYSLKLDPKQPYAYQGLGNCFYAKNQAAQALTYYKYSLVLNPNNPSLSALVARLSGGGAGGADPLAGALALYKQGQYAQALGAYQQVASANPQNAKAYQGIGNCQFAMNNRAAAVASYRQSNTWCCRAPLQQDVLLEMIGTDPAWMNASVSAKPAVLRSMTKPPSSWIDPGRSLPSAAEKETSFIGPSQVGNGKRRNPALDSR